MKDSQDTKEKIRSLEERILKARHLLEGILPVWTQVDRKKKHLELEIDKLEEERLRLQEGQLNLFRIDF